MTTTPYLTRFSIFLGLDGKDRATEHDPSASRVRNPIIRASLVEDVNAVLEYRARSDRITKTTIRAMFSRDNPYVHDRSDGAEYSEFIERVEGMIDENRDFIYTKHGLNILKNRYLFDREPVQIGMLRAAKIMTKSRPDLLKECYDLLSCGFVHISSIIASADLVVNDDIRPGEACRLMVAKDGYDQNLISQIENVCKLICLGVGVGLGVSNLPANGKTELGQIRSGFMSLVERLNSCNFISLHERKPKIALYLHVHNDTVRQALTIKMPSRVGKINNVFIGLMIPNHFMDCVKDDKPWYLFPGDMVVDGKNLANLVDDEYIAHFERCVDLGLYTQQCQARDLMRDILQSLVESGAPYIIWSDHLNRFNNQKAYGTIKTLNLCAEITNYANSENDSSCTLLSCNMAMWKDFPNVFAELRSTLEHKFRARIDYEQFDFPELAEYAYTIGYYGTVLINGMFGEKRARREIGLNPLGVYDMALMADRAPDRVCATISEALYRGAVTASCDEYDRTGVKCSMYDKSEFAFGRPQFVLRSETPQSDWSRLRERMTLGMANSMLTSQAPTATTSLLTGATESVIVPISHRLAKESENGRNEIITYGLMYRILNGANSDLPLKNDINDQLRMYTASLPYIDHSQSVMLSLDMDVEEIYKALIITYKAKMKTAVYYLVFKQAHQTINSVQINDCSNCTL